MEPTIEQTKKEIANAASEAVKVIAAAASEAAHTIASAVADAKKITSMTQGTDHDLLTELKTEFRVRMDGLKNDIADIKSGTAKRIDNLEIDKLDVKDSYSQLYKDGIEKRLSSVEKEVNSYNSSKNVTNVIVSIGIFLLLTVFSMLVFHLFGIKL